MSRNMTLKEYVIVFVLLDVALFFLSYVFHAYFIRSFAVSQSLLKGTYEVVWRLISLQVLLQLSLFYLLKRCKVGSELAMLVGAILAFVIATGISSSKIPPLSAFLSLPTKDYLPEPFALLASLVLTTLILKLVELSNRGQTEVS